MKWNDQRRNYRKPLKESISGPTRTEIMHTVHVWKPADSPPLMALLAKLRQIDIDSKSAQDAQ